MPEAKADLFEYIAMVGKAYASPKRLELLDLLAQGERTVDGLARAAGLGTSTASAHLQILKMAGLVAIRREGTRVHYRLADDDVAELLTLLRSVALHHLGDVERARDAYLGLSAARDVEELSRAELVARVERSEVVVIDVRPPEEYAAGHIPGARSVPFGELEERLGELDPDIEVVAYCRGAFCVMAHDAVRLLHAHGQPASRLEDGMLEWRLAGHDVEVGAA